MVSLTWPVQLYLRIGNFHPPWPLPETLPSAFVVNACASGVTAASLLPVSLLLLASLPGAPGWWVPLPPLGLDSQVPPLWEVGLESHALPPLLLLGSLGLQAQLRWLGGQGYRHCLSCSPDFTSSMSSSLPTFRYTNVGNSAFPVCWVEEPSLSCGCFPGCGLKGRNKGKD